MTPDKDIQILFDSANVPFTDKDAFLETLSQRLEKIEFIKENQDARIKRYKASVIYSLIVGLVIGAGSMALLQALPIAMLERISSVLSGITMFEIEYSLASINLGIAMIIGIAVFLIVRNVQDIHGVVGHRSTTMTI